MRIFWWMVVLAIPLALIAIALKTAHSQPLPLQVASVKVIVEQPVPADRQAYRSSLFKIAP